MGFDVQIRLSPFIPEFLDIKAVNSIGCRKAIVEFLRANEFIKNTFQEVDYSIYTHKENGYYHLELDTKKDLVNQLTGFKELSIFEDCTEAYGYWKNNINYNKDDCCNLRIRSNDKSKGMFRYIGNIDLMKEQKIAFLCSTNAPQEARLISKRWALDQCSKKYCIISGFQSEAEKDVLNILLSNNGRAIMILPYSMYKKCPEKYYSSVNDGRLLILSFFEEGQFRINRENAEKCNIQVLKCADSVIIGYAKKDGMISHLVDNTTKPKKYLIN